MTNPTPPKWRRITIHVPDGSVVDNIDALVGPRGRSALLNRFLVSYVAARRERDTEALRASRKD